VGFIVITFVTALGLGVGLWGSMEIGYRLGKRERRKHPSADFQGLGAIENAIYALLGLILAFTFTGALGRIDLRRQLIVNEANAIGTAYLLLDLLPNGDHQRLRPLYQQYLKLRIEIYQQFEDENLSQTKLADSLKLQSQIWQITTNSVLSTKNPAIISLLLSATSDMIDVSNERLQVSRSHPPDVVFFWLVFLSLASGVVAGFNMSASDRRSPYHIALFCLIISGTVFIIIDLEYPRRGLFRIGLGDQVLMETLAGMEEPKN